jgi:hypothetical protein
MSTPSSHPDEYAATDRTRFKRRAQRGTYERAVVHAILDEALLCHVAFAYEGKPAVLPMMYARQGERLLLHGSSANRMLRALAAGADTCVCVTLLDALVLARSAIRHSANYRSVVIYGRASELAEPDEKREALRCLLDHVVPGRGAGVRAPSEEELAMVKVIAVPILEASAKVRTGPPNDDEADYARDVWAGVLPLATATGAPEPCPRLKPGTPVPEQVRAYRRRTR